MGKYLDVLIILRVIYLKFIIHIVGILQFTHQIV
jgi:hypothetical protein